MYFKIVLICLLFVNKIKAHTSENDDKTPLNLSIEARNYEYGKWRINLKAFNPDFSKLSYFLYIESDDTEDGVNILATLSEIDTRISHNSKVIVSCVSKQDVDSNKLRDDYIYRENFGYYKFHPEKAISWKEAKTNCENKNASLAMPNSKEEANLLIKLFNDTPKFEEGDWNLNYFWVGFHNPDNNNVTFSTIKGQSLEKSGYYREPTCYNFGCNVTGGGVMTTDGSLELWDNYGWVLNYFCKKDL